MEWLLAFAEAGILEREDELGRRADVVQAKTGICKGLMSLVEG